MTCQEVCDSSRVYLVVLFLDNAKTQLQLQRIFHAIFEPLLIEKLTDSIGVEACIFHQEACPVVLATLFSQPPEHFLKAFLIVIYYYVWELLKPNTFHKKRCIERFFTHINANIKKILHTFGTLF